MSVGSLFAGIGGFDLAARWMGWETKWFSEIEPYACKVLKKHWPTVPNHGDITQIRGDAVEQVDILCGGFPCQDISLAGKGAGITGTRSGLWQHYHRLIEEIRPRYVIAENVSALRSRGLDKVLREISALGYDAEWHCIPAAYVGAPHRRDRIWIIAYANSDSERLSQRQECNGEPFAGIEASFGRDIVRLRSEVSHSDISGLEGRDSAGVQERSGEQPVRSMGSPMADTTSRGDQRPDLAARIPLQSFGSSEARLEPCTVAGARWWFTEPSMGRVANGVPKRVDRLRCLGNAIVPQVAYLIFQAIQERERRS